MLSGCCFRKIEKFDLTDDNVNFSQYFENIGRESLKPEEPILKASLNARYDEAPLTDFDYDDPNSYLNLTLQDCIDQATQNSSVARVLNSNTLRAPQVLTTAYDPAILFTDPRFGEEAALSAFDANLSSHLRFDNVDRVFNNRFTGANGVFIQDLAEYQVGLAKRAATGSLFQFNQVVGYDRNNSPSNRYNDGANNSFSYDAFLEAEIRQPLLQGAGVTFNRIAGPNNQPGVNNGILIARANTDISLAEFEEGIRDLVSNVENAYWDLYFAYRDLEAKIEARDGALRIWQSLAAQEGRQDEGEIAQAEEQYFRFASEVEDAVHGRRVDGTQTNNGSLAGTFRSTGGVRIAERRLRLIVGYPMSTKQLIKPSDTPFESPVKFSWQTIKNDALALRPELRKQRWQIKKRELELTANRNLLLPQLDLTGKYRFRGFGHGLFGNYDPYFDGTRNGIDQSTNPEVNALSDLLSGDRQEWQLGVELNVPIGFRRQYAAVRSAQLALARAEAILAEQERYVVFGLADAMEELIRSDSVRRSQFNRLAAAEKQFKVTLNRYEAHRSTIDLVLEAQRRVIEAKLRYFQTQVEYMLAIKGVHYEKGTLLDYHGVTLTESAWPAEAYRQALEGESLKIRPMSYIARDLVIGRDLESPAQPPAEELAPPGRDSLPAIAPPAELPGGETAPGDETLPLPEPAPTTNTLPQTESSPTINKLLSKENKQ